MSESAELEPTQPGILLQKLSARHRNVASLLSQGVPRLQIAKICEYTPEYVTWLQSQPLFIEYVKTMNKAVGTQLEALFGRAVDVIQETMDNGTAEDRLRAAKLQMEATGRIGRERGRVLSEEGVDRLEALADRLVALQRKRNPGNGEISEAEILGETTVHDAKGQQVPRLLQRPQSAGSQSP